MTSIEWIIPFALYPTLAALYYGGAPIRFEGPDNARQLLGVALGLVIFVAVWGVLKTVIQPMTGPIIGLAFASHPRFASRCARDAGLDAGWWACAW